jgi:pimeloyl-ACP methyl ester carboxylesterase
VAATRPVLDRSGPCILVGHSYGGMVITEADVHPSVKALVYVAAFEPNVGESAGALNGKTPPASNSIMLAGQGGLLSRGLRGRRAETTRAFHGDLASANLHRGFRGKSYRGGMVEQAQLRGHREAGSDDQSGSGALHDWPGQVRHHRDTGKPRRLPFAFEGSGPTHREGGECSSLRILLGAPYAARASRGTRDLPARRPAFGRNQVT